MKTVLKSLHFGLFVSAIPCFFVTVWVMDWLGMAAGLWAFPIGALWGTLGHFGWALVKRWRTLGKPGVPKFY